MYQDSIKHIFKTLAVTLCCALFLAILYFFIFGIDKQHQTSQSSLPMQTVTTAQQNPADSGEKYQEGKHYQKLSAKITTDPVVQQLVAADPGKIQVIEFFNYACLWCQYVHPKMNEWLAHKPSYVILYRYPIIFNKGWEVMAKAYLMVQMLHKTEALDDKFFQAIHKDNIDLANEQLLQEFFAKHGVEQSKFLEMYGSFAVTRALQQSNDLANAYQITVSPAIIVNGPDGSYLITASLAGSNEAIMDVLNFLVEKESKALERK